MRDERNLLVVSGPSGCGKDSVVQCMLQRHEGIEVSVSATTRQARPGEQEGVDYFFLTLEEFERHIAAGDFLEYAKYVDNCYGTLKSEVDKRIHSGIVCVLVIEVFGAENVKKMYPGCTTVFILPPNMDELERRLRSRGTENEEWVCKRMKRAREEMPEAKKYDYTVVNDELEACAEELYGILCKERLGEVRCD